MSKLPESWEIKSIKEFANIVTGNTPPTKDLDNFGNEYPWITPTDISTKKYISSSERKLSEKGFKKARQLPEDTVLITSIASIGKNAILKQKGSCNQQINAILPSKYHDSDFIYYWFENNVQKLKNLSGQTAVPILNKTDFSKIQIPLPPLEEQKKIAEILSTVDQKIAFVDNQIEETELLKKGLMQKLLTEGIGHSEFKDSELGRIPVEWEVVKLEKLSSLIKDGTHGTHKEFENGIPLLSAKDINNGKIDYDNCPRLISREDFNKIHKNYTLKDNDILLTVVGTLGRAAIVKNYSSNYTFQRSVAIIRLKQECAVEFYYQIFKSNAFQKQLILKSNASAQAGVYLGELAKLKVILPPLKEQKKIAEILSTTDEKLENLKAKKESFEELKKGLMQKLLTGEVRV